MDKKEAKKWLATGLFGSYGVIGYMPGKDINIFKIYEIEVLLEVVK